MKRYVEDIGYIEVTRVALEKLPNSAIYFNSDEDMHYYIEGCSDEVYAVDIESIK